ncbi:hypothetical protein DIURU_001284 [Diutina rugosa]|uniref:DnaJ homolog 1, mitochondrial n=1 Tax=Diutina rugosa TaxID=5481 RepID=A0A642V1E8_DIURU|nr:uncharacterized protein DIURU_001284 [Diutina rugosa]KAA8905907.1 hypothetical protein DIURU_001284 [Diutina rugosa]
MMPLPRVLLHQAARTWAPARHFHASASRLLDFDPYKTLGIDKSADQKEVKKAYYQLVKKYHPDVNKEPDAEKKFHKIQESYELLSDKDKRAQYDQFGPNAFDNSGNANPNNPFTGGGNPFQGGNPFGRGAGGNPFAGMGFDFEDLFKEAFTGGGQRGRRAGGSGFVTEHVGDNIEVLKAISFKDAIFGAKTTINYNAVDTCHTCSGSGLKAGKQKKTCPTCHGSGQSTHIIGGFHMASTCGTCGGSGVVIPSSDQCGTCHGRGVEEVPKSTTVEFPPGVADGSRLRVPGAGDAPFVTKDAYNQTRHGDLIVRVSVKPDPKFTRHGNNLVIKEDILMTTAALGGEIVVPTIDGQNVKLKVRPGVQNGRKLTIPEKGVPINRNVNNRGDLEVVLNVKALVPETPLQTALLEALADSYGDKNAKRTPGHESKLDVDDIEKDIADLKEKDCHPSTLRNFLGKIFGGHKKDQE